MEASRAIVQCTNELSREPANPELRFRLARAYLNDGNNAAGIRLLTELTNENYPPADLLLGMEKARGTVPGASETEWLQHFERAKAAGHFLASYLKLEAKYTANRKIRLTKTEIEVVRGAAETGLGRAWFILFYVDQKSLTERLEHLRRGDDLGHLHSTNLYASLLFSSSKSAYRINPTKDLGSVYKAHFTRANYPVSESIRLFEKVLKYSQRASQRSKALQRLVFTYLFAEGSLNENPERATELFCNELDEHGRKDLHEWKSYIRIPDCN